MCSFTHTHSLIRLLPHWHLLAHSLRLRTRSLLHSLAYVSVCTHRVHSNNKISPLHSQLPTLQSSWRFLSLGQSRRSSSPVFACPCPSAGPRQSARNEYIEDLRRSGGGLNMLSSVILIHQGNEVTPNSSGRVRPKSVSGRWAIVNWSFVLKSGTGVRELISTLKKKKVYTK